MWASLARPKNFAPDMKVVAQPASDASKLIQLALSLGSSVVLFVWLVTAVLYHFDDPHWPTTSVPMFSMLCAAGGDCDESFRSGTYTVSRAAWRYVCLVKIPNQTVTIET